MCGIFGFCGFDGATISFNRLQYCTLLLTHRGPDTNGFIGWSEKGRLYQDNNKKYWNQPNPDLKVGLGHCRLSILDLSDSGRQPMVGNNGTWIVHNGEIYNYLEIRSDLINRGYSFNTNTDTEIILSAYQEWGVDCIEHFNGMWSFAIYDSIRNSLFCSRDRLGIKPFYFQKTASTYCFASEIYPIIAMSENVPRISADQIAKYLVYHLIDDGTETIYKDIYELRGGHSAWIDLCRGQVRIWRYWRLPDEPDLELTEAQALDTFSEIFEDSVRLRLRSDVPVAVALSGGIDSSAVTVAASKAGAGSIQTFTSHFPDSPDIDESKYALIVAKECNIQSKLVEPNLNLLLEEEPLLTKHQEMPFSSLSLYVHWAILNQMKKCGITVVLSGQGGDELFMGYERYYIAHIFSHFPNIIKVIKSIILGSARSRLGFIEMGMFMAYFGNPRLRSRWLIQKAKRIFRDEILKGAPDQVTVVQSNLRKLQARELVDRQLTHLLRFDDRTSSAHGMETRLPFLDYRLVEFAYRLPWKFKIRYGWTKYLIRLYLQKHVPKAVAWRRQKLGFNAPQKRWTKKLVDHRGKILMNQPFAKKILRQNIQLEGLPLKYQWDVYNLLHLAYILNWDLCE